MNNQLMPDELIMNKIYLFRGHKVMLDEDLAKLYQVTTGNLNKSVARNIKRFPEDFMFRLKDEEFKKLAIPKWNSKLGRQTASPECLY